MRRVSLFLGFVVLLALGATAQERRSEVSLQGTGFFTQNTSGQGISRTSTDTGGFLVGYRYHFNRWLAGEANYGWDRDTEKYFSTGGFSRVQSDVHTATADAVISLPFTISRLNPYVLGGGGSLVFHPTGNAGGFVPGATTQAKGAFLYGAGVNYTLTRRISLRAEYRGYVYKDADFGLRSLDTDSCTPRNHLLELFSGSDPTAPSGQDSPAYCGALMSQQKRWEECACWKALLSCSVIWL
jgi:opacity protein-like surface antigen